MIGLSAGTSCLLWPLTLLRRVAAFILKAVGRVAAVVLGFSLMMIGTMICFTIIGIIIGVPLIILGFLLVVRGIF